jgi:hypothetical protein
MITPRVAAYVTAAAIAGAVAGVNLAPAHPAHVVPPVAIPTAPCVWEDSPGPCVWDAGIRGNGHGYSFWVDRSGRVHYLTPSAVSR